MGYINDTTLLAVLLSVIVLITFFVMSARLKRIMIAIESLSDLELRKPGNMKAVKCEKCEKEFPVSIVSREATLICPHCKTITRINP